MNEDQQSFADIHRRYEELFADLEAGKPIPTVDPLDFKKVWRNVQIGEQKATAIGVFQLLGLRMDDVPIIGFRATLLHMLLSTGKLKPFEADTKAEDAVLNVAATFPFTFREPKKPDATLFDLFDVGAFMKQVQERTGA